MITIDVPWYCQECKGFEPETTKLYAGDEPIRIVITCESAKRCERLMMELERRYKKKAKEEEDGQEHGHAHHFL